MPRPTLISQAFRDLADDLAWHGGNLVQGAFDLTCLVAVVAGLYAASLDKGAQTFFPDPAVQAAAAPAAQPVPGLATCVALTEAALPLDDGCISAQPLSGGFGT